MNKTRAWRNEEFLERDNIQSVESLRTRGYTISLSNSIDYVSYDKAIQDASKKVNEETSF